MSDKIFVGQNFCRTKISSPSKNFVRFRQMDGNQFGKIMSDNSWVNLLRIGLFFLLILFFQKVVVQTPTPTNCQDLSQDPVP